MYAYPCAVCDFEHLVLHILLGRGGSLIVDACMICTYVTHCRIRMRCKKLVCCHVIQKFILFNFLPLCLSPSVPASLLSPSLPHSFFSFLPPPQGGVTALMKASQAGHLDVVRTLLTKEAGIDLKCRVSIIDLLHCIIHWYLNLFLNEFFQPSFINS